jgi:hypothetical protein
MLCWVGFTIFARFSKSRCGFVGLGHSPGRLMASCQPRMAPHCTRAPERRGGQDVGECSAPEVSRGAIVLAEVRGALESSELAEVLPAVQGSMVSLHEEGARSGLTAARHG